MKKKQRFSRGKDHPKFKRKIKRQKKLRKIEYRQTEINRRAMESGINKMQAFARRRKKREAF